MTRWILLLVVAIGAGSVNAASAQGLDPTAARVLTTVEAVQALSLQEADRSLPIRLEAVVTLSHQKWRLLFVQDASGGVYCEPGKATIIPEVGQRVAIEGISGNGSFLPVINVTRLTVLGPGTLPSPRPVTAEDLWLGKFDGDFVRLSGYVISSQNWADPDPSTTVRLLSDGLDVNIALLGPTPTNWSWPNGSLVQADGVFGPRVDHRRRVNEVTLSLPDSRHLTMLRGPEETLAELPPSPVAAVLQMTNRLARVQGIVTVPLDDGFWLADAHNGIVVQSSEDLRVNLGDRLDVAGLIVGDPGEKRLHSIRTLSHVTGVPMTPTPIDPAELFELGRQGQLVRTTGEFLYAIGREDGDVLLLKAGGRHFEVRTRNPAATAGIDLKAGSKLEVTGIVRPALGTNNSRVPPRLITARENSIRVLTPPPWPKERTLGLLTALSTALAAGVIGLAIALRKLRESNSRVERAEQELRSLNGDLERRIALRTAELESANLRLNEEIKERQRTAAALAEREIRFRTLVENVETVVWEFDAAANQFTYVSPQAARLGYPLAEWSEPGFWQSHIHPDDREAAVSFCYAQTSVGAAHELQYRFATARGDYVWLDDKVSVETRADGSKVLRGVFIDITTRKQSENALRESEERFARAFHASPAVIVITRQSDARYIDVNDRFSEVMGHSREQALGRTAVELGLWVDLEHRREVVDALGSGRAVRNVEGTYRTRDGHLLTMLTSIEPIVLGGEQCLLSINHDITRRKKAEDLRDEQNKVIEMIARGAPLPETLTRLALAIEAQSDGALCAIQLVDKDGLQLRHVASPNLPPDFVRQMDRLSVGATAASCGTAVHRRERVVVEDIESDVLWAPYRHLGADVGLRACWAMPIFDAQRRVLGAFAVYRRVPGVPAPEEIKLVESATHTAALCITHFQALEALRESEERFQYAMRGANDGLWDWNLKTNAVYYSPRWKSMLGYEDHELENHLDTWSRLVEPSDGESTLKSIQQILDAGGDTYQLEFRLRHKLGHWVTVLSRAFLVRDSAGAPLRFVGTHLDISAQREAERTRASLEVQLRQSQKMEAIGTLAGGIAHDFNNILGAIFGYTQLAQNDARSIPSAVECLDHVLRASQRAKELVRQILTFSRHEEFQRSPLFLDEILTETTSLLRATLPASINLVTAITPPVPAVNGNATLMQQVIINLATNAAQAIGQRPGRISIELRGLPGSGPDSNQDQPGTAGGCVVLSLQDDGPGMNDEVKERIFEPFFTTKGPGEGTGLGLSVVHGIVQSHHGTIRVQSDLGAGTRFEICLPALADDAQPAVDPIRPASSPRRGSERILLVDDEPSLLKVGERILRQSGYEVTACLRSDEAFEIFRQQPGRFDLLITDYSMPGQSGVELGAQLRSMRPDLPMLICTGYSAGLSRDSAQKAGFIDVLQKPVELDELILAVRSSLDRQDVTRDA